MSLYRLLGPELVVFLHLKKESKKFMARIERSRMSAKQIFLLGVLIFLFGPLNLYGYHLPSVNLGTSNFLDGGPLRMLPGWYWGESTKYYHSNRLIDNKGNQVGNVNASPINVFSVNTAFVFQSDRTSIIGAKWGFSAVLPIALAVDVSKNSLGLQSAGAGFGDLAGGAFLQWETLMRKDGEPLFVHRIEFDVSFPTGKWVKNKLSPGNGLYFLNPYWAGAFYFSRHWAISWRLHYLWNSKNKQKIQPGTAVYANFDMEYEVAKHLWVGLAGYWLQQVTDDHFGGIKIPGSRERVIGLGPGILYRLSAKFYIVSLLYFETNVRNRAQGTNFITRMLFHF